MGTKAKNKSAAAKSAALSPEEFQKLTPEEQVAHLNKLQDENATLQTALKAEEEKDAPPSFEVEEDAENEIEGGEYEFTAPTFTWDDNSIIESKVLVAAAEGKDKKLAEKAAVILGELVKRKSGLVKRKED